MSKRRRGRGEGGLYQVKSGRQAGLWRGAVYVPDPRGGLRRRVVSARRYTDALARLDQLKAALGEGQEPPPAASQRLTWSWLLDGYLARLDHGPRGPKRPRTRESYEGYVRLVRAAIGHVLISATDEDLVEELQEQLQRAGYAPRSIHNVRTILSGCCKLALRKRLLRHNPLRNTEPPEAARPSRRALTSAESLNFLRTIRGHRLEPAILALALLGVRRGEVLAWHWSDLDLEVGTVLIRRQVQRVRDQGLLLLEPKSAAGTRLLPLPGLLLERLRALREEEAHQQLVFPSASGGLQDPRNFNRQFTALVRTSGVAHFTPHELRHTLSSLLQAMGVPPLVVAQLLGHADPAVTMRTYGQRVGQAHRDAVAVLDRYVRDLQDETADGRSYTYSYTTPARLPEQAAS